MAETIFALSSGALPSGVAVIRLSGSDAFDVLGAVVPEYSRSAGSQNSLRPFDFVNPVSFELLDQGLILTFKRPASFTGEDVVEFHCHGGHASVAAMLDALGHFPNCRDAEPGEFSRRAFENGKMDLTEIEGLSDLISAQTNEQRRQALKQSGGVLRTLYDGWRSDLVRMRALIEAELDFSDEDDVPGAVSDRVWIEAETLVTEISGHLKQSNHGEIVREGFRIALLGPPNSGKSSLMNALAARDVAIVTDQAGTTRDLLEVSINLNGYLVRIVDTAGIRHTDNIVEVEGIRRAKIAAAEADLVFWLVPAAEAGGNLSMSDNDVDASYVRLVSKSDLLLRDSSTTDLSISVVSRDGFDRLFAYIESQIARRLASGEPVVATRNRHRAALKETIDWLENAVKSTEPIELRAESLRKAADSLGRITGRVDVEDLLGYIFAEFCVGK